GAPGHRKRRGWIPREHLAPSSLAAVGVPLEDPAADVLLEHDLDDLGLADRVLVQGPPGPDLPGEHREGALAAHVHNPRLVNPRHRRPSVRHPVLLSSSAAAWTPASACSQKLSK